MCQYVMSPSYSHSSSSDAICWMLVHAYATSPRLAKWSGPHQRRWDGNESEFHNVTCYTNSIVSHIHVNTTKLRNITCTLVATSVIIQSLECKSLAILPFKYRHSIKKHDHMGPILVQQCLWVLSVKNRLLSLVAIYAHSCVVDEGGTPQVHQKHVSKTHGTVHTITNKTLPGPRFLKTCVPPFHWFSF